MGNKIVENLRSTSEFAPGIFIAAHAVQKIKYRIPFVSALISGRSIHGKATVHAERRTVVPHLRQCSVRNVIDFGVFVDIGVHQDGLVHISEITDKKFIKHPFEVVSVGDIVDVKVLGVDMKKKRIQLTMKGIS